MTFLGLWLLGLNNAAQLGTDYPHQLVLPAAEGFRQVFEENMHDKRHYLAGSQFLGLWLSGLDSDAYMGVSYSLP